VNAKLPKNRISGAMIFGGVAATVMIGFYFVIKANGENRKLALEKRERRASIIPFLQAETDVIYVRMMQKEKELEAMIMSDVPGWDVNESVYKTREWRMPFNPKLY